MYGKIVTFMGFGWMWFAGLMYLTRYWYWSEIFYDQEKQFMIVVGHMISRFQESMDLALAMFIVGIALWISEVRQRRIMSERLRKRRR